MATKTASTKSTKKPKTKSVRKEIAAVETNTTPETGEDVEFEAPEYSETTENPEIAALEDVAVVMQEAASQLPEEALLFLVRSAPVREVWQWLSDTKRVELLQRITRGFQRTANTLRQSVVRTRLAHHLRENPDDFQVLLKLWSDTAPQPHVVIDVREYSDDSELIERLQELWQNHGTEPLLLALLRDNRQPVIDAWETLVDQTPEVLEPEATDDTSDEGAADEEVDEATAQITALSVELESAQSQLSSWQSRAQSWQQRGETAEAGLSALRESARKESETLKHQVKQETRRADTAEEQLGENKRLLDRTARRLKSVEKELTDATTETKRLKRQMLRQQQLNEEIRKQLANVTARLEALTPAAAPVIAESAARSTPHKDKATPKAKAPIVVPSLSVPARTIFPLDQLFVWQSDGRQFKLTPRDVQRAIDRNDEDFVFTLIQSLDAMRENSVEGFRLLIARIREIGRYYSRVLTADTTRVLVDASNVARYEKDRYGKGQLRHLLTMRDELRRRDCFPVLIYADASLPYNIDEPEELLKMVKNGEVQMSLSGQEADELLAREARRTGAYVVTNDRGFHLKVTPDFEPPRISFRIYDGVLVVDDF